MWLLCVLDDNNQKFTASVNSTERDKEVQVSDFEVHMLLRHKQVNYNYQQNMTNVIYKDGVLRSSQTND